MLKKLISGTILSLLLFGFALPAGATTTVSSLHELVNTDRIQFSTLIGGTTTAFGGSLLTDLLPIAGFLAVITIVGMILHAIIKRTLGGISRIGAGVRKNRRR